MRDFFKRLFCKHNYRKIGFKVAEDADVRYSLRHYECTECEKRIWVDGRFDN